MAQCSKNQYRTSLPAPMFEKQDINMMSILKGCIGKDLSKITMPVHFNEPLSFLQRMVEYMEYSQLMRIAAEQTDPINRLKYIAAFAVSALACNWDRMGKPFNPLLGETYEIERPEFRCLCEQVSHHPPVSAFHAESPSFQFYGSIYPKIKFWGKSIEIQPKGTLTVKLPKWDETYSWNNPNCTIHNVIVGKLWMEQYGTIEIVNHQSGLKAILQFKATGSIHKDLHRVEGTILDGNKKKLFLYGRWTDVLKCTDYDSYEAYLKDNPNRFKRSDGSKSPNSESPAHTPRKVFSKLNSLKMSSFRSLSIQDNDVHDQPHDKSPEPETVEMNIPKSQSTYSIEIPNSETLWTVDPRPESSANYFSFTNFAMSLNELESHMTNLQSTDSRLRPDIRKLEHGDVEGAIIEKNRLEEKQRDTKKARKSKNGGNDDWKPRYVKFICNAFTLVT
ncbi:unnamed protein product [Chironomus riparius]|uniref:Oxysterol-binding protein n=1 Tax=Chironomus riparius TaxID=315576 RepID=A0A9P0IYF9_9DIPT|nr:unnamed protein product [Chironomus riparius]